MSGRKVLKRACDGCKIRKIKCNEVAPCDGCIAAGIACTFVKHPAARGPRKLRTSTLKEISRTQQQWEQLGTGLPSPSEPVVHTEHNVFAPAKVAALVLQLCVYRLRVYPIWPIIKVERLVASLQKPEPDIEVFALAYAVAAATIARIKPKQSEQHGGVTAQMMEAQCQYAKARRIPSLPPDLTTVRIPFFLHIYYEEIEPGGLRSIIYLREAITVAHMIGLHREVYYQGVSPEEQEIRRRTLWLLFVTERGLSIKYKLPVTIKTKINFPSTVDTDEHEVLLAYQKLISMFWHFDKSGVFDLLDNYGFDFARVTSQQNRESGTFASLRRELDNADVDMQDLSLNNVQALDIQITRHWMRIILWRLGASHGFFSHESEGGLYQNNSPISIAKELLEVVSQADKAAIEAHGPAMDTKIFEIASTVVDACTLNDAESPGAGPSALRHQAIDILDQMYRLLGRNAQLANMLQAKLAQGRLVPHGGNQNGDNFNPGLDTNAIDPEIDRQLQAHGFHFTEPQGLADSPDTASLSSDRNNNTSPQWAFVLGQEVSSANYDVRADLSISSQDQFSSQLSGTEWDSSGGETSRLSHLNQPDFDQLFHGRSYDFHGVPEEQPGGIFGNTTGV